MMSPVYMSAVHKANALLGSAFAAQIRGHAEAYSAGLQRLGAASEAGDQRLVRKEQTRILNSYSARFVCLVRSAAKEDGFTPETISKAAQALSPWHDCGEPIRAWPEPKSSGEGWRPMCSFGPKRRALQRLCGDIITARHGTEPVDFLRKGRGCDVASDHINHLIEKKGYKFFVLADVKDFYRSVQHESLREALGLPAAVMNSCVLIGPDAHFSYGSLLPCLPIEVFDGAVRQGLPQGSRTSTIIAGLLLGPVLREEIPSEDRIVVHGDDIAVAARDEMEAKALKEALPGMLASHPAGPFQLKHCDVHYVGDGFDFLKYRHRRDPFTGRVHRRPARKSYWRYTQRVIKIASSEPLVEGRKSLARYGKSWVKAFPRWRRNWLSKCLLLQTTHTAMKHALFLKASNGGKP